MKCIKAVKASKKTEIGTILRIDNVEAEARVLSTYWDYISKSEWKASQPKSSQTIVDETNVAISVTKSNETISEKQLKSKAKRR